MDDEKKSPEQPAPHKETLAELDELLATLPTIKPATPRVLWKNNGVLAIS